jgi:predicted Fe-Mo cluster-binding NifX family protein
MKIVVSARDVTPESEVDPRFGRAAHFLLFDSGNGSWEHVENQQALNAAHGAGIQAAETVCRHRAGILITGHVGPKAFAVLSSGGVKVYRGDARTAREAVEDFQRGRLMELNDSNGP